MACKSQHITEKHMTKSLKIMHEHQLKKTRSKLLQLYTTTLFTTIHNQSIHNHTRLYHSQPNPAPFSFQYLQKCSDQSIHNYTQIYYSQSYTIKAFTIIHNYIIHNHTRPKYSQLYMTISFITKSLIQSGPPFAKVQRHGLVFICSNSRARRGSRHLGPSAGFFWRRS